jgi:hypothetical protein
MKTHSLTLALLFLLSIQQAPAAWDWQACLPGRIRAALPVTGLGDPFSPPGRSASNSPVVEATGAPDSVRNLLDSLAGSIRACLTEPTPLLLIGRKVFRPGDEIPPPDPAALPGGRILLQRIDAEGAHLTLWIPSAGEGPPRQQEALLRVP